MSRKRPSGAWSSRAWACGAAFVGILQAGCGAEDPGPRSCEGASIESQSELAALVAKHCTTLSYLEVEGDEIRSLDGLEGLREVTGSIRLAGTALESVEGLRGLEVMGTRLEIRAPSLASVEALQHATGDELYAAEIQGSGLTTLEGLEALVDLHTLTIVGNPELTSTQGLRRLEIVRSNVAVKDNPKLRNLRDLQLHLPEYVSIERNGLESLTGLKVLYFKEMNVSDNPSLTSLDGLEIGGEGSLRIERNPSLPDLEGLYPDRLDALFIDGNQGLQTLSPAHFWRPNRIGGSLRIRDNPLLPQCDVDSFVEAQQAKDGCVACAGNGTGECSVTW